MIEEDKQELLISEDTYKGRDLGVTLEAQACHFKVWSPLAVQMELLLYPPLTGEPGGRAQSTETAGVTYAKERTRRLGSGTGGRFK